jgi:putative methionine-R-sulfoxide reductase with GAF domain
METALDSICALAAAAEDRHSRAPKIAEIIRELGPEIIIPVFDSSGARVIGTVDVRSERVSALSADDPRKLEPCAGAALPLWLGK